MHCTVTIKMQAQNREELIDTFGAQVELARVHFEQLKQDGAFGRPENVELRYLVVGGGFRAEPAEPEHPTTPDVE